MASQWGCDIVASMPHKVIAVLTLLASLASAIGVVSIPFRLERWTPQRCTG